jgi:formylmethanofuran dehydrogenase subunit E
LEDESINPLVFGTVAASHIKQARIHRASGNHELANTALNKAEKTAKSSSCPGALQEKNRNGEEGSDEKSGDKQSDESDSKSGKIRCIKCRETVRKRDVVTEKSWRCPHCKYEVDICNGAVMHESEPPEKKKTKVANWLKGILKLSNE